MKIVDPWGLLLELAFRLNLLDGRQERHGEGARIAWEMFAPQMDAQAVERLLREHGASDVQVRDFWAWQKACERVRDIDDPSTT